jgi:hypothetical protein
MKLKTIVFSILLALFFSCNSKWQLEKVPLKKYSAVYLNGLAGESLEFKPDSTFEYTHSTCLTRLITVGKYSVENYSIRLFDFEDLSSPLYTGSSILKDTFFLDFPNGRKIFSIKTDTIDFFQPYGISEKVPSKVLYSNKILYLLGANDKSFGTFPPLKK